METSRAQEELRYKKTRSKKDYGKPWNGGESRKKSRFFIQDLESKIKGVLG
jgi:hypothetical protein